MEAAGFAPKWNSNPIPFPKARSKPKIGFPSKSEFREQIEDYKKIAPAEGEEPSQIAIGEILESFGLQINEELEKAAGIIHDLLVILTPYSERSNPSKFRESLLAHNLAVELFPVPTLAEFRDQIEDYKKIAPKDGEPSQIGIDEILSGFELQINPEFHDDPKETCILIHDLIHNLIIAASPYFPNSETASPSYFREKLLHQNLAVELPTEAGEEIEPPTLPEIPGIIGAMAEDVARVTQIPIPPALLASLAVAAAALGKSVRLYDPIRDRHTQPNLFALIPAESGTGKGQLFRRTARPLSDIQGELMADWSESLPGLKAEKRLVKKAIAKLEKGNPDSNAVSILESKQRRLDEIETIEGNSPRMVAQDVTVEKLAVLLQHNQETLALVSFESGGFLSNLAGRNNPLKETDEHLLLSGFSVEPFIVDRITRPAIYLERPCLTLLIALQPGQRNNLFAIPRLREGGFIPRLLISPETWPHIEDDGNPRIPKDHIETKWNRSIREAVEGRKGPIKTVEITPEANEIFRQCHNEAISKGNPVEMPILARRREIAQRLALVIHSFQDHPAEALAASTAQLGCSLAEYYTQTHRQLMAQGQQDQDDRMLERIAKAIGTHGKDGEIKAGYFKKIGIELDDLKALAKRQPQSLEVYSLPKSPKGGRPGYGVKIG